MAVNVGDLITAADYNSLQGRVSNVLGNGSNEFGYGQSLDSSQTSIGTIVTAQRLLNLRADMNDVYTHQTGNPIPLDPIATGNVIGADESEGNVSKGFNDYLTLMATLENNKFDIALTQQAVNNSIESDTRTSQWSYASIITEFTVSFTSVNARRYFFNSGGQIRVSGAVSNLASGSQSFQRNLGWQDMVENPGVVLYGIDYVDVTNTSALNVSFPGTLAPPGPGGNPFRPAPSGDPGPGGANGEEDITSTYQTIFRKDADAGVYENSYWTVEARNDSNTTIRYRVTLVDSGPETGPIQEPVTADITINSGARRSAGAVEIPFPAFAVTNLFE